MCNVFCGLEEKGDYLFRFRKNFTDLNTLALPLKQLDLSLGRRRTRFDVRFTLVHVSGQRVTAVQLDKVHVPFGERVRVQLERSQDSWIAGAREVTIVFVNTKFQSSRVDLQQKQ